MNTGIAPRWTLSQEDQTAGTRVDRTVFLRRSLLLDGIASGLCGMLLVVAAGPISVPVGLPGSGIALALGLSLVVYAAALLWSSQRAQISRTGAVATIALNLAWVAGSITVIAAGPLTVLGDLAVAVVAGAVLVFAVLEIIGLRRLRQA